MARDYVKLQLFKLWSFVLKNNLSVIFVSHLASTTSGDHNDMPRPQSQGTCLSQPGPWNDSLDTCG